MIQLYVLTADADAAAVMRVVLELAFSHITWQVERHEGHDAGMVKDGPERIRLKVKKDTVEKVLLLWDHHGSGCEKKPARHIEADLLLRLEQCTWKDRSAAISIVPELEEWICRDLRAIQQYCKLKPPDLEEVASVSSTGDPKGALTTVHYRRNQRGRLLPLDFQAITEFANLKLWRSSESFDRMITTLETWFPANAQSKGPNV